jgi:hypothetical protein
LKKVKADLQTPFFPAAAAIFTAASLFTDIPARASIGN